MTTLFLGIGVATACPVAMGAAYIEGGPQRGVVPGRIQADAIEAELARFDQAVEMAQQALLTVRAQIPASIPTQIIEFIDSHLLMLGDAALLDEVRRLVAEDCYTAEWALESRRDALIQVFEAMEDSYLRTRKDDIDHVVGQIQRCLRGESSEHQTARHEINGRVVVARELTPARAIALHRQGAVAFVTEFGGPLSHTAILARSLDLPAVIGAHGITRALDEGEFLIVDSDHGTVLAGSDETTRGYYRTRLSQIKARQQRLRGLVGRPSYTRDGVPISLLANLEQPRDVHAALDQGAAGIGLYRTEFLYMDRQELPDEEEHLANYAEVLRGLGGLPVTIRTLDLGADKETDWLGAVTRAVPNPALGLRAVRLCLKEPDLFNTQLRAILRASALGPVRLLLPMISTVQEIDRVLAILERLKCQLDAEGLAYDSALPVGAMIEVPAAALAARAIARRTDFLSIGTNDLIQYTVAVDRADDSVNHLFHGAHPGVLRLIRMIIEAARALHRPVGMCGEMAADPRFTRLLLGIGLRELSMQPGALLAIKELVLDADVGELQWRASQIFARIDETDTEQLIDTLNTV